MIYKKHALIDCFENFNFSNQNNAFSKISGK